MTDIEGLRVMTVIPPKWRFTTQTVIVGLVMFVIGCLCGCLLPLSIAHSDCHHQSSPPKANVTPFPPWEKWPCPAGGNGVGDTTDGSAGYTIDPMTLGCTAMKKTHNFSEFNEGPDELASGEFVRTDCVEDPSHRPDRDHLCLPDYECSRMKRREFSKLKDHFSYTCEVDVMEDARCKWQHKDHYREPPLPVCIFSKR